MPTRTEATVDGYVWCCDPACDGNDQRPAVLTRTVEVYTYGEADPESVFAAFPERSCERFAPVSEDDAVCPECGGHTDCSPQKRPVYHSMMRGWDGKPFDQMALIKMLREKPSETAVTADADVLKAQMAEMRAELRALRAEQGQQPAEPAVEPEQKRGPGRPRKTPEGDE